MKRLKQTVDITSIETGLGIVTRLIALAGGVGNIVFAIIILLDGLIVEHVISGRKKVA